MKHKTQNTQNVTNTWYSNTDTNTITNAIPNTNTITNTIINTKMKHVTWSILHEKWYIIHNTKKGNAKYENTETKLEIIHKIQTRNANTKYKHKTQTSNKKHETQNTKHETLIGTNLNLAVVISLQTLKLKHQPKTNASRWLLFKQLLTDFEVVNGLSRFEMLQKLHHHHAALQLVILHWLQLELNENTF